MSRFGRVSYKQILHMMDSDDADDDVGPPPVDNLVKDMDVGSYTIC